MGGVRRGRVRPGGVSVGEVCAVVVCVFGGV